MAQSVKRLPLGFGSGHDLTVHAFGPVSVSGLTVQSLPGIPSAPPPPHIPLLARSLSLSK